MVAVASPVGTQRYRVVVEGALLSLQLGMGLSFIAVAPLFTPIIDDYGVSRATVSLLVAVTSLVVAVAMVPSGVFSARFGWRRSVAIGGALMSAVALTPLASGFLALLALRVVFAVGASIVIAATPAALMRWFPPGELPLVNGMNVVAQSLGVTTSVLTGAVLAEAVGWRATLMLFGMVSIAGTMVWLLVAREPLLADDEPVAPPFSFVELRAGIRQRAVLLLGIGMAGGIGAFIGLSSWLPTYYHEEFGFTLEHAGSVAALPSFFGIVGSVLGSVLAVRFRRRKPLVVFSGVVVPVAAVGSFASSEPLLLYPSVALLGVAAWLWFPAALTIPMELPGVTPERATVAIAAMLSIGNLSGFFVPLVVGAIRDATGSFEIGLGICAAAPLLLLTAALLLPETGVPKGAASVAAPR